MNQRSRTLPRRLVLAGAIVAALVSCAGASLIAHGVLPRTSKVADALVAITVVSMYVGAWTVAMSFSKSRRGMFLRAVATTLTLGAMLAMLEIPAAFNLLDWSSVFRRLSG